MRFPTTIQALSAAGALVLLAGCSSGSALAPKMTSSTQSHVHSVNGRSTSVLNPVGMLRIGHVARPGYHGASYNACPATGILVYVSDAADNTVNIFAGNLAGQSACGILTGFVEPQGITVHDDNLYVANTAGNPNGGGNVLAFKRGATTPFITYSDPSNGGNYPAGVTVSNDNVVIASNIISNAGVGGLSTWNKHTGAVINNYLNSDGTETFFVTIQKDGTTYYDGFSSGFASAVMSQGSCVAGVCGAFADTAASLLFPGGIRSSNSENVDLDDQSASGGGTVSSYTSPNFATPVGVCTEGAVDPVTIDINHSQHHLFYADAGQGQAFEMSHYNPGAGNGCTLMGSVFTSGGEPIGVAIDTPTSN